ncbi:uncharacterized protein LOC123225547 isoform X2 [Mangifera indica]|uniref:uncharacterized protein LOC123225547 isoform X2 n=1 Tax=Mangifera indica TaxID=29780 RepID=UPI001CFB0687|nr:uncharacterized protein LOC123225547 isoform X2 [Mangifera indica]
MFINRVQSGVSSVMQGVVNRPMLSTEQGQSLCSMGLVSQPVEGSLYGAPVATVKGNMGQYSHAHGIPQAQKNMVQSSGFSNSFLRDRFTVSPDQASMPQGAFMSSQGFSGKNIFGQVPNSGSNTGILSGNLQEANSPQTNSSMEELNGRQEQTAWSAMQQKATQNGPNQGLVPLDPMEEKILFNMDEDIWDASFGRRSNMGTTSFGNMTENLDLSNSFPSLQSGSWSALMQSAVAEASSSDTGMQEWSGLTFQNTEQSTDNQLLNLMKSDNQQTGWVDNNLPTASFTSKPLNMFNDSNMNSSFPGFRHQGFQFSGEQREGLCHNGESMEKSPKVTGEWVDYNPQQKPSIEDSQQVQSFMQLNNAWAGQINERSEGDMQQQGMASHVNLSALPNTVKSHQTTSQYILQNNQSDYVRHADISIVKRGKESMGKGPQQTSNGPHAYSNSYNGEVETYEKQKSYHPRENSNGGYHSKGMSGSEQGHASQFQFLGNVSSNTMVLEQAHLAHVQGKSRASEEVPSEGDLRSVISDCSNIVAQARLNHERQNMLELLNKVDQSREDGTKTHFGSADGNPMNRVPETEVHTSGAQLYNPSSTSQGFGLRLGRPSQRLPNSSHLLSAHGSSQAISYLKSSQADSELKEKSQTWVASSSSFQTFPPTHDLSQRANWEDKASAAGQSQTSSYLNMQGNSNAAYAPSPSYMRNQPQMQFMSSAAVSSQASQATVANTTSRHQLLNRAASHDTPQQIFTNLLGQQFPVLEAVPVSQPSVMTGMPQQGKGSARPHNLWTNVTIQRQPPSPSSRDPSNNSMINSPKGGYGSPEFGASEQLISSERDDTLQPAGSLYGLKQPSPKHVSDTNALLSGSQLARAYQQALNTEKKEDSQALTASEGNLLSVGQSLESSPQIHQNYSQMGKVQAVKNIKNEPSSMVGQYEHNSKFGNIVDSGQSGGVQPNSFLSRDTNMMSLQDRPYTEISKLGQTDSQNQPGSNMASNLSERGQVNLRMVPSWFNKYGTLQNGQIPQYDARFAKMAAGQLSLEKLPQNLHMQASLQQVDTTDASQGGTLMPSALTTLVGTEHSLGPSVLPSDITNQSMAITRSKKRKIVTPEVLPWHKEVTKGFQWLQNMSMAEEQWALATNRLIEKVQDEVDILEDVPPVFRSKRRLVLTTQLMQQLLSPAPESILSADLTSHYDSAIYSVSRLVLGDACSLTHYPRNDLLEFMDNCSMNSAKLDTSEGTCEQQFSEVVEKLTARAKKIENEFQRVEKTASMVDIAVECQELERFAVINRFAKLHIGGQADISGTSLSSVTPKPFLQRYVTALPMPRKLPEGLQCVSL